MTVKVPVITIDGPSGVGKGTLCRLLAQALTWHMLDSGSLYRLTAFAALQHHISLSDEMALAQLTSTLNIRFLNNIQSTTILLDDLDVSDAIRSEECGTAASKVAMLAMVRSAMLARQQSFRQPPGLIADGRDMGTVVFPDADAKIFLSASAETRAIRRYKQLKEKGINANLASLTDEIAERDKRDTERQVAPLKPAADATLLDTTDLSIDEVKNQILMLINQKINIAH